MRLAVLLAGLVVPSVLAPCDRPGSPEGKAILDRLSVSASPVLAKDLLEIPDLTFVCTVPTDMYSAGDAVAMLQGRFGAEVPDTKIEGSLRVDEMGLYVVYPEGDRLIPMSVALSGINVFGDDCVRGQTAQFVRSPEGHWDLKGDTGPRAAAETPN